MTDPSLPNLHGDDPRRLGGDLVGPGGPYDANSVIIDPTNSVILRYVEVTLVHAIRDGRPEPTIALKLEGRINKTDETTRVVYMVDADGAAAVITELLGVIKRAEKLGEPQLAQEMREILGERWDQMPT